MSGAPERPIPRCLASTALLAQMICDKFCDHLPLYRQLQRFERVGIQIGSSTFNTWVQKTAKLLQPLYELQQKEVLASGYVKIDESPVKVLNRNHEKTSIEGILGTINLPKHFSCNIIGLAEVTHPMKYWGTINEIFRYWRKWARFTGQISDLQASRWNSRKRHFKEGKLKEKTMERIVVTELGGSVSFEVDMPRYVQNGQMKRYDSLHGALASVFLDDMNWRVFFSKLKSGRPGWKKHRASFKNNNKQLSYELMRKLIKEMGGKVKVKVFIPTKLSDLVKATKSQPEPTLVR